MNLKDIIPEREWEANAGRALSKAHRLVTHRDNFTTAVFWTNQGAVVGEAKRNPNADPMVEARGEQLAIIRAYRDYQENGWREDTA